MYVHVHVCVCARVCSLMPCCDIREPLAPSRELNFSSLAELELSLESPTYTRQASTSPVNLLPGPRIDLSWPASTVAYPEPGQWCGGANSGGCIAWQLSAGKTGPGKKGGLNGWWNQT